MDKTWFLATLIVTCLVQATLGQNVVESPQDTIMDLGGTARLECRVSASFDTIGGEVSLIWGYIGEEFDTLFMIHADDHGVIEVGAGNARFRNFEIEENGFNYDMVISNVEVEDEGEYTCYFNEKPERGAKLMVQAQAKVEIDESKEYVEVTEGKEKIIQCSADDANPPANFTWYKDSVEFDCYNPNQADCYRVVATNSDDTTDTRSRLALIPTFEDHNRTIMCESLQEWDSENKVDPVTDSIKLNVLYSPRVTVTWSYIGQEATCNINANPDDDISYEWYINGVRDDQRTDTWKMDRGEDVTEITCFATNRIGTGNHTLSSTNFNGANTTRYSLITILLAIMTFLVISLSN